MNIHVQTLAEKLAEDPMQAQAEPTTADAEPKTARVPATAKPTAAQRIELRQLHLVSNSAVLEEGGPPLAGMYSVFAILLLIVSAIGWAANTDVVNASIAPGAVAPSGAVVEVQHFEGGIIADVPVSEGDIVEAGDLLMVLDPTADGADLQQIQARQAALVISAERLRAEAYGREPDFGNYIHTHPDLVMNQIDVLESGRAAQEGEKAVLESRLDQRISDIEIYRLQADNLQQQLGVVGEQLNMRQTLLARGLASRLTVLDVQREYTRIDGELVQARTNLGRSEQAAQEARHAIAELELGYRSKAIEDINAISSELAEVNEMLTRLEDRVARREIRSPTRGIVNALPASTAGQVVQPGQVVASIVPSEGGMVIVAQLSPSDVGYVAVGQEADLMIDGFDLSQFGTLTGTVSFISPTTFATEEGMSYYRIRIEPSAQQIGRNGNLHTLVPGMVVQASIRTGEQSMLSYLIRPVYRSLNDAFGER